MESVLRSAIVVLGRKPMALWWPVFAAVLATCWGTTLPHVCSAQDYEWTGAGSSGPSNWHDHANWYYDWNMDEWPIDWLSVTFGRFVTTNTVVTGNPLGNMAELGFLCGNFTLDLGNDLSWDSIWSGGGTNVILSPGVVGYDSGSITVESGELVICQHLKTVVTNSPSYEFVLGGGAVLRLPNGSDGKLWISGWDPPSAGTVVFGGTSQANTILLIAGTLVLNGEMQLAPRADPFNANLSIDQGHLGGGGGVLAGTGTIYNCAQLYIPGQATLQPGNPERDGGIGTLTFTNSNGFLVFRTDSTLEVLLGNRMTSAVRWTSYMTIQNDGARLALVQKPNTRLANGTYTLLTYTQFYTGHTFDVTFNGGPLPDGFAIEYGPTALVLRVSRPAPRATIIQIL